MFIWFTTNVYFRSILSIFMWKTMTVTSRLEWREQWPSWVNQKLLNFTRMNLCLRKFAAKFADAVSKSIGMSWKRNMIKRWKTIKREEIYCRKETLSKSNLLNQQEIMSLKKLQIYSHIPFLFKIQFHLHQCFIVLFLPIALQCESHLKKSTSTLQNATR